MLQEPVPLAVTLQTQWQAVCVPAALQVTWPLPCSYAEWFRAPLGGCLPCPKQAANQHAQKLHALSPKCMQVTRLGQG